jgi:hypothetical protein
MSPAPIEIVRGKLSCPVMRRCGSVGKSGSSAGSFHGDRVGLLWPVLFSWVENWVVKKGPAANRPPNSRVWLGGQMNFNPHTTYCVCRIRPVRWRLSPTRTPPPRTDPHPPRVAGQVSRSGAFQHPAMIGVARFLQRIPKQAGTESSTNIRLEAKAGTGTRPHRRQRAGGQLRPGKLTSQ